MARLIPSEFDLDPLARDRHGPEARTLLRLRDGLGDGFVVYHGVHWTRADGSGSVYGEIDFIVANRWGRLLAIEQKDAHIVVDNRDVYARYGGPGRASHGAPAGIDKSVTTQVNRNLNALRAQFTRRHPGRVLDIDHLLYLPGARLAGALPSSVDPARVVDAHRDAELVAVIEALLADPPAGWSDDRLDDLPHIEAFLTQRVGAVPDIGLLGRAARETTTRLSGGLSTWAGRLSMAPWRLRVQGTAGSGKTQLALQVLREARAAGCGALYVCFNRPLADAMRQLAPDPGAVVTFHEFARLALAQAGRPDVAFDSPDAFDVLARGFIELAPAFAGTFDTLVIDEGQDFEPAWADSLVAMVRPEGRLLWLEDPEQSLYDRAPVALPGWVTLASPVNYRSPRLLVDFINWLGLTADAVEAGSAVVGFDPRWYVFDDAHPVQAATEQAVADLLAQGYEPDRIAVLSVRGLAASLLAGAHGPARLAGLGVRRQAGYDAQGAALWTDGNLLVDTVFRFKGQAADAVVITEIDFETFGLRERRRLFVALTRARLQVALVTSEAAAGVLRARLGG